MENSKIALFQKNEIRKIIHENEWWFVINDVITALTDSSDPAQYFKRMKSRNPELKKAYGARGGTNCTTPYAGNKNCRRETENVLLAYRRYFQAHSICSIRKGRAV